MKNHVLASARKLLPFQWSFGIFIPAACYESNRPLFSLVRWFASKSGHKDTKALRHLDLLGFSLCLGDFVAASCSHGGHSSVG